jgi:hypothetical protein
MSISPVAQRKHLEKGMIQIWLWANVKEGADLDLLSPGSEDFYVQVLGTFGGASVVFDGSLSGQHFGALPRGLGESSTIANSNVVSFVGGVPWVRPRLVGGDDTTDLNILLSAVQS